MTRHSISSSKIRSCYRPTACYNWGSQTKSSQKLVAMINPRLALFLMKISSSAPTGWWFSNPWHLNPLTVIGKRCESFFWIRNSLDLSRSCLRKPRTRSRLKSNEQLWSRLLVVPLCSIYLTLMRFLGQRELLGRWRLLCSTCHARLRPDRSRAFDTYAWWRQSNGHLRPHLLHLPLPQAWVAWFWNNFLVVRIHDHVPQLIQRLETRANWG